MESFHACLRAPKAVGKGDGEESNAARLLYLNPGDKQACERRGFQELPCFLPAPVREEGGQQREGKLDSFCSLARESFFRHSE